MAWSNHDAIHRHACHACEDFRALRRRPWDSKLWHSLSHHLRHVAFRSGHEVSEHKREYYVRRTTQPHHR